jgi:hypothetical protein
MGFRWDKSGKRKKSKYIILIFTTLHVLYYKMPSKDHKFLIDISFEDRIKLIPSYVHAYHVKKAGFKGYNNMSI